VGSLSLYSLLSCIKPSGICPTVVPYTSTKYLNVAQPIYLAYTLATHQLGLTLTKSKSSHPEVHTERWRACTNESGGTIVG